MDHSPDRDAALAFVQACQRDPTTSTAYLGEDPAGVGSELAGWTRPWLRLWHEVRAEGHILAACTADWDPEPSMAWIHGPWGSPAAIERHGADLVAAVISRLPAEITHLEMCGHVTNTAMAALADRLGWTAGEVNLALGIPAERARLWPRPDNPHDLHDAGHAPEVRVRRAVPADVGLVGPLHTAEFGAAYATARQLVFEHHTVVAADPDGVLLGYATGSLQEDGQAYVDFTAVDPGHRRRGLGRRLVVELVHVLLATGSPEHVHLTVRASRTAAQGLYGSLGLRQEAALRGYRGER